LLAEQYVERGDDERQNADASNRKRSAPHTVVTNFLVADFGNEDAAKNRADHQRELLVLLPSVLFLSD